MKRSRFSEEQIICILKTHQAGMSAQELCRKHRISDAAIRAVDPDTKYSIKRPYLLSA